MQNQIEFIGTGVPTSPINQVAGDVAAAFALHGYKATDEEIREELRAAQEDPTAENVARVREIAEARK